MAVIAVFNQKGGCAKTMTTMQLAGALGLKGLKVFVVDMDPQNTAALWFHQATPDQPFPADVLSMAPLKEAFLDKLGPFIAKYDAIIIDSLALYGTKTDELSPEDRQTVAGMCYNSLFDTLSKNFKIAISPGPKVLRLRSALTQESGDSSACPSGGSRESKRFSQGLQPTPTSWTRRESPRRPA